ncbi:hypothetical protein FB45DRAFT_865843 [Roridomyces roridus]|uniref:RING-type domain-containing protein n=1 Tax=Roridomyces roridus TaxID=1738132 RepID=A0AAD7C088_9AGAR|nr:hypothetical protein FB45DRAFT_865843 [Roridomyces roridus]
MATSSWLCHCLGNPLLFISLSSTLILSLSQNAKKQLTRMPTFHGAHLERLRDDPRFHYISGRCMGHAWTTGSLCKRTVRDGVIYCYQHQDQHRDARALEVDSMIAGIQIDFPAATDLDGRGQEEPEIVRVVQAVGQMFEAQQDMQMARHRELDAREAALARRERELLAREQDLLRREEELTQRERAVEARAQAAEWEAEDEEEHSTTETASPPNVIQRIWRWFFVDGTKEPEGFDCPICHDTLNNPVKTPCDHTFCKECIKQWLNQRNPNDSSKKRCYCSREVTIEELRPDRDTERAMTTAGLRPAWLEPVTVV